MMLVIASLLFLRRPRQPGPFRSRVTIIRKGRTPEGGVTKAKRERKTQRVTAVELNRTTSSGDAGQPPPVRRALTKEDAVAASRIAKCEFRLEAAVLRG